jgi:hypothetical protein
VPDFGELKWFERLNACHSCYNIHSSFPFLGLPGGFLHLLVLPDVCLYVFECASQRFHLALRFQQIFRRGSRILGKRADDTRYIDPKNIHPLLCQGHAYASADPSWRTCNDRDLLILKQYLLKSRQGNAGLFWEIVKQRK